MRKWIGITIGLGMLSFPVAGNVIVLLQLDSASSSLSTTLCVQNICSEDTHPLEGEILLELGCANPPTEAAIRDFQLQATTNHVAHLDFGIGGKVDAILRDLAIHQVPGPTPAPPVPVVNGMVVFRNLTNQLAGDLEYHASGFACAVIQIGGLKCDDQLDLSQRPPNAIEQLPGELKIEAGQVRMTGTFGFRQFIDSSQPDLGQVNGRATISAAGPLRPVLEIRPVQGGVELGWCRIFLGARLESSPSLVAGPWQVVEAPPEMVDDHWTVRLPAPALQAFYRLRVGN